MPTTDPSLPPRPAAPSSSQTQPGPATPLSSALQRPPAPPQEHLLLPGERLTPSPTRDRPWRVLTVLLGASVISILPLVLVFFVFQKYVLNADVSAGLKD